jgi:hypothetical protein
MPVRTRPLRPTATVPTATPGTKKALVDAGLACDDGNFAKPVEDTFDWGDENIKLGGVSFEQRKIG